MAAQFQRKHYEGTAVLRLVQMEKLELLRKEVESLRWKLYPHELLAITKDILLNIFQGHQTTAEASSWF